MSNCTNFCTRAECEALAARIGALEQALELLEASFEAHTQQQIPQAHQYTPEITVNSVIENGELITDVTVDRQSDFSTVPLPDGLIPFVTFDIFELAPGEYVFKVGVNGEFDEDTLIIEQPIIDLTLGLTSINEVEATLQYNDDLYTATTSLPRYDVAIDTFEIAPDTHVLTVQVGEERAETTLYIPEPQETENIASQIQVGATYSNDILTIQVSDGQSGDVAQVFIDADVVNNFGGGGNQGEEDMSCENLSQELTDCCGQILAAVATNLQKIQELEQYVTVDVSSSVCSDYKCEFPTDQNDQPLLTYAEATLKEKEFEGKGIAGLNERLKYLATNQDAIYKEICKAIDPVREIRKNDFYSFCNLGGISRNDYEDTSEGTELYEAAVEVYLAQLASESKYGYLINAASSGENPVILSAPASYINNILIDFALIQSRNNSTALCAAIETEPDDVVSVVASPEVITNVAGKVLILHFVTLENYPKRQAGSYPRPVQIPAALESYEWDEHFKDLRWVQGNQYGELELEGYRKKVSGWFRDEAAGNAYFDAVLNLTTAVQKNRNFPKHLNPRTDIVVQEQRPHRAFIESVNPNGRAICHVKYRPNI